MLYIYQRFSCFEKSKYLLWKRFNDLFDSAEGSCPSKYSIDTFKSIQSIQTGIDLTIVWFYVYNCCILFLL